MVEKSCPVWLNGKPGPVQRWIEHAVFGEPRKDKCHKCGGHHIAIPTETGQADPTRYGRRNIPKMYREINVLRAAIRADGTPAIQTAWDAVEEHIDFIYRPVNEDKDK